jgi:hypothetical protein
LPSWEVFGYLLDRNDALGDIEEPMVCCAT